MTQQILTTVYFELIKYVETHPFEVSGAKNCIEKCINIIEREVINNDEKTEINA